MNEKSKWRNLFSKKNTKIAAILALFVAVISVLASPLVGNISSYLKSTKAQGDTPAHHKKVTPNGTGPNGDGTYKISLDVTGDSEKKAQKANVIVVFDSSSSMNRATGNTETTYTETNSNTTNIEYYGKANDEYFPLRQEEQHIPFTGTPSGSGVYYGYYNNQYVSLYYNNGRYYRSRTGNYYYNQYNGTVYTREYHYYKEDNTEYTGQRYIKEEGNQTRLQAAKKATNNLAKALLDNNGKNGNPTDTIQIALVDFANTAEVAQTPTTNYTSFETAVNNRDAGNNNRGTNWEAGFRTAQTVNFGDNDPTYVIFVSDGNPTYYLVDPGNTTRGGSGSETNPSDNVQTSYDQAVPAAQAVVNSGKTLYTIGIYGNVDRMESITTEAGAPAANYYSAENTAALQEAFARILEQIEMSGIGAVQITDGTTENVSTSSGPMHLLTVSNKFEYTISFPIEDGKVMINTNEATLNAEQNQITWGNNKKLDGKVENGQFVFTWTGPNDLYNFNPPEAKNENSEVKWDLSQCGVLVNGATYTVSFDVWPSQETYDLIAELKNGKPYSSVPAEVRQYLSEDFVLKTNTGASLTYTDTRIPESTTVPYEDPGSAPLESSQITFEKVWIDGDSTIDDPRDENGDPFVLTMNLIRDGSELTDNSITVSKELGWSKLKYIATGLMRTHETSSGSGTIEILDTGHDYSLKEPEAISYHWELTIETAHPMIINGTLTTLVEVKGNDIPGAANSLEDNSYTTIDGVKYYKFNGGKVYKVKAEGASAGITAYNNRKSYLEFNKKVTGDAPEGKEFNFSFNIHNVINPQIEEDDDIWFSVYDTEAGETVMELETNAEAEIKDGEATGYYSIANDSNITVKLQDGWNLRVINLGTGSTYTINEVGIATENTLDALDASDPKYFMITGIEVTTTLPAEEAAEYTTTKTKTSISGTISKVNTGYSVEFTNDYPGTYLTVNKEWVGTPKDKVNVTLYQSIDGATPTATDKTAELSEENEWTYTFEGLPLREKGTDKPITYSVQEDEVKGYKTTIEQDEKDKHIWTITNAELTTATVVKDWNDDNNRDGLRKAVEMTLTANNQPTSTKVTLTEDKEWKATVEGLDKYDADGEEITYSWIEETVPAGYVLESTSYDKDTRTTTIKNKHDPELVNIKVIKNWDDADDQDGKRPTTLAITLKGDGETVGTTELKPNDWAHTFEGLFKYAEGELIEYTVEETLVGDEYTYVKTTSEELKDANDKVIGTSFTIENTHTIAKTNICVNKVWNDNDDQDGYRPEELIVNLLINGAESGQTATLNAQNGWSFTWENLDAYREGALLAYSVNEASVPEHYTQGETSSADITDNDGKVIGKSYTLNNDHEIEKTFRTVYKDWDDADDQDGARPDSIKVSLTVDGEEVGNVTLSEDNNWEDTITDLDVKANGQVINYIWSEEDLTNQGYELTNSKSEDVTMTDETTGKEITGIKTTLTNTHEPELTVRAVKKVWDDADDQDGYRPDNLTVTLKVGEETKGSVTLSEDNNWEDMITNLPKYADGEEIQYVWVEDSIDDYELTDTTNEPITVTDEKTGIETTGIKYTLTNTHVPEKTKVTVVKDWDDTDNQDGMRPNDLTVTLTANGEATSTTRTLTESNGWKASVEGLDVFADGEAIEYSWSEPTIDGYKPNGVTTDTVTDEETGKVKEIIITLTNTHETEKTYRTVKKAWDDADDQDGYRPDDVTVNLQVNGQTIDTVTLNEGNNWEATIADLDTYADGVEINYVWSEVVPNNYTLDKSESVGKVTTITNKHVPETTEVAIEKVWDDADDQDGYRPENLTVTLKADDEAVGTVTLNEDNDWKASKTGLPKKAKGTDIVYTWDEGDIEHYELTKTDKDDITVDNKVVGVKYTLTNSHETEEVEIQVEKVWDDADDQDGYRPEDLTVTLKAGDETVYSTTLNENNQWKASKTGLPKKADGVDIEYSWDEGTVAEYELTTTSEPIKDSEGNVIGTKFILTNKHVPEEVEIQVEKVWVDNDDQDGYRPDDLQVELKAGDETVYSTTLNENNQWKASKTGLPKKADGVDIEYSWDEGTVAEYELTTATESIKDSEGKVIGTKFILTNTHKTEKTQATVKKVWDDADDQDGKRPGSLNVKLLADGAETGQSVTLSDDNEWEATIKELDTKANGTDIVYSWEEETVAEYTVTGNSTQGTVTTITNKHIPEEISVTITKSWDDETNNDGVRPASIIVHLLANGTQVGEDITLAAEDWTKTITGLPKYADGKVIEYTVTEDSIENYSQTDYQSVDETDDNDNVISTSVTITNTHTISKTNICITKAWDDASNQDNYRPDHVLINVLAETDNKQATIVARYTLEPKDVGDDEDHWTYTFEDMPEYDEGLPITYTIEEVLEGDATTHYTQVGDPTESEITDEEGNVIGKSYEITNKHETDKTEITVKKAWDDANDQDGKRPESVAITLYADGEEVETVDVTDKDAPNANTWTYTWTGLEKNKRVDGVTSEIEYTVDEKEANVPEGYEKAGVDETDEKVYTITNKHDPEKVTVSGQKEWDMTANIYGFNLPSSIEIKLMKGEEEVDSQTVVPDNNGNWNYSFEDLDKYENKEPITYTVTETPIRDYDTEIIPESDYVINVKNTYNPEPAELNGTKTWDDNTDQDGARPKEIKITLVAMVDGEEVYREKEPRTVTGPENYNETNWSFTFNDLPARTADGKEITWVAEETLPDGYTRIDDTITLDIVNKHTPELVSYTVRKVWDDEDNAEGLRPSKVVFYLDADGDEIAQGEANEDNDWTVTFSDLPKFRDHGTAIEYTIREDKVNNYDEPVIEKIGDYEYTVTNIQLVNIHIVKTWNDNNNEFNVRPDQIIVDIFGDGELIDTITITSKDNWTYTYPGLPKYNEDGEAIEYTLREKPIEHYIPTYEKFNIFNDVDPDSIEIIPPDTGVDSPEKNIGVLYLIVALVSVLGAGFKKVFE